MKSVILGITVLLCLGTGCGYLDTDIFLSDDDFESSIDGETGTGSGGFSGYGFSGCGGGGHWRVGRRLPNRIRVGASRVSASPTTVATSTHDAGSQNTPPTYNDQDGSETDGETPETIIESFDTEGWQLYGDLDIETHFEAHHQFEPEFDH